MKTVVHLAKVKGKQDADFLKLIAAAGLRPGFYLALDAEGDAHIFAAPDLDFREKCWLHHSLGDYLTQQSIKLNAPNDEDDE